MSEMFRNNFRLQNRVYFTEIDVIVLDVNIYNLAISDEYFIFLEKMQHIKYIIAY